MRGAPGHLATAWAIVFVILNLRLQVWLATFMRVDLVELHRLVPLWVVPSATLFLVLWVAVVAALTKSRKRVRLDPPI